MNSKKYELEQAVTSRVISYLLAGEDTPEILEKFNGIIDSKYKRNPKLKVLNLREIEGRKILTGSSPLITPIINSIVSPGYRTARPEEVETTLQGGDPVRIRGNYYVNYGLVLDFSGSNHDLAIKLFKQLPKEIRDFDRLPALMIGYGLRNSDKGNYGVAPVYQEGTELRTAKIFVQPSGNFDAKDAELICSGLPFKFGDGTRRLHNSIQREPSKDSLGISGFDLGYLDLCSDNEHLACSYGRGSVVLVRDEAVRAEKRAKN